MTGSSARDLLDVRRLCEAAHILTDTPRAAASPHPLASWIKMKHEYKTGQRGARLPKSEEGFAGLRDAIGRPIDGLDERFKASMWRSLLVEPGLVIEMPPSDPVPLAEAYRFAGLEVIPADRVRVLVLAVVARPSEILFSEGAVQHVPIAGVAHLALETEIRPDVSRRAWIDVVWTTATRTLCRELESALFQCGPNAKLPGKLRSALLLRSSSIGSQSEGLVHAAAVLGFKLEVISSPLIASQAAQIVKRNPPTVLMIGSSIRDEAIDATKAAQATGHEPFILPDDTDELLLEEARQRLIASARLTPSLLCMPRDAPEAVDSQIFVTKSPLPVTHEGRCKRHNFTNVRYVEDLSNGYWFTSDNANHTQDPVGAPVAFKRYTGSADGLHWDADLDDAGHPITEKHKGDKYLFISWNDLHGC